MAKRILWIFAGLMVSACGLVESSSEPVVLNGSPAEYSLPGGSGAPGALWYESFGDLRLETLILAAQKNNLEARQALARIVQARALVTGARSERLPSLDLQGSLSQEWEDGDRQETHRRAGASLSWEIDLFNRLGAEYSAQRHEERASKDDLEAVRLSLSAEIARSYFTSVAQHRQLSLLQEQIQSDRSLLDLIRKREAAGIGTNVEVLQQKSQLADNQSLIPLEEAALRLSENRLDVLLAEPPDGKDRTFPQDSLPTVSGIPATGVPSDLLLNRPDLRAMKSRLVAQDAQIEAAIAETLPRISLSGSFALVDGAVTGSPVSSLLGSLVQPLLDWGKHQAEVKRNKALYEEKLAAFTQAYLIAIEEVENTLYQENRQREYLKRLDARRDLLAQTLDAAQAVYKQGESDYMPVLTAVRDLRAVERSMVRAQLDLVLLRIALFKALGGSKINDRDHLQERE